MPGALENSRELPITPRSTRSTLVVPPCPAITLAHDANPARLLSFVPRIRHRHFSALVMVHYGVSFNSTAIEGLFFVGLERAGISITLRNCAVARVRPCAGLPASRWTC